MRLRSLVVALGGGAILAVGLAGIAGAHVVQQFGPYSLAIGWLHEPAYVGLDNAVQVIVKDPKGASVDDVPGSDFTVTVSTADQSTAALPLNASFDPDTGLGVPGEYTAHIIPTVPGGYTFHVVGTIHGTKVDQSFTSSETTFDTVQGQADAQFPVKVPSGTELSTRVDRIDARVQAAQAAADGATTAAAAASTAASDATDAAASASVAAASASAAAASASDAASRALVVGAVVGGVGVLLGLIGIGLALRARRRAA
jgi:hypothetical protein